MSAAPRARHLAILAATLLVAGACGHDWSAGDGAADGDVPPTETGADVPGTDDAEDGPIEGLPDAPLDAGPDTTPDVPPDVDPDVAPDVPPDVDPDVTPDLPPDDALDVVEDAAEDAPAEVATTRVDLVVLAENTGSFTRERDYLRDSVATLFAALDASTLGWDLALGVAAFGDFPVSPYGGDGDVVFEVLQPMTTSTDVALADVGAIADRTGADGADGAVVALALLATGSPLAPYYAGSACSGPGPATCFRSGATRIVLLFTDSTMHNGPPAGTSDPYNVTLLGLSEAPDWPDARDALAAAGIRVVGLNSGDTPVHAALVEVATATGAVVGLEAAVYDIALETRAVDLSFLVPVLEALVP